MALYGAFSSATLGMLSQAKALHNISTNIANVNTGGFKGTDTQFSTVLSKSLNNISDIGGVRPKDISTITQQGNIVASSSATDVAIAGKGFFVLNTQQDGTGESLYGRDGSLEIATVNDITVNGINNTPATTKDGYLVDKNGYFIQGWAYANGTVSTTGTPSSLRVDQYAFTDQFNPTTTANLNLNLPAGDTLNTSNLYDITVYDSTGAIQNVSLNFQRTAPLTWNMTTTSSQTPVAQVDTLTLAGTPGEVGDQYGLSVNGKTVNVTTDGTETTLDEIRDKLILAINNDTQMSAVVTAAAGATGEITLTAVTAGTALNSSPSTSQGPANVARQDTVTLAGAVAVGDVYDVTINGITLSVTAGGGDTLTTVRDNLLGQINGHGTLGPLVTVSANGTAGIDIISDAAGTDYTLTTAVTDAGGSPTNTAVSVINNYTALNDNSATSATTTANVINTTTSAATVLTFNSDGSLATPTTIALNLTFNGGGTTTATVDISNMTSFYGDFLPINYTKDGFAKANMKSFNFDSAGNVVGVFEDNTFRQIYKLSLGVFSNPNGLEAVSGNVFRASNDSGLATITTAGDEGYATFTPNARELSNVDIGAEFAKMITTQTAYNSASTVFRTVDEMITVARDLKR